MKKIAIISRALMMNGATKALVEMLKRVDMTECQIDLWVLDMSNIAEKWVREIPDEVRIRKIPQYSLQTALPMALKHPVHFFQALWAGSELKKEIPICFQWKYTAKRLPILDETYDVAISFRHFDIDVFYVINNVRAKKKYFWIHGVQQLRPYEVKMLQPYYKKYDGIMPVSYAAKANFVGFFPQLESKCTIAYCVVDAKELHYKSSCGPMFVGGDEFRILTIGRLGEEKAIDIAVDAANILNKRGLKFKWLVAGDGNQRCKLTTQIKEYGLENKFVLLGNIDNPYGFLASCDVYVQPSRLESYGLAINEAKIFHRPIICSDIPAGREQIEPQVNGLLFDGTAKDLADQIFRMYSDEALRNGFESKLAQKDWSHFEVIKLFDDLFVKQEEGDKNERNDPVVEKRYKALLLHENQAFDRKRDSTKLLEKTRNDNWR